jgi:hypothetical protein
MLEGKIFFGETGKPILKIAFENILLALAEPVPFTFAKRMTISLTIVDIYFSLTRNDK